jgi:hypothetical protein
MRIGSLTLPILPSAMRSAPMAFAPGTPSGQRLITVGGAWLPTAKAANARAKISRFSLDGIRVG